MLAKLRNVTRGWVAGVIIGLLAIAFAVWGVNDIFTGGGSRNVASVGGNAITPMQLSRELDLFLRGQRREGQTITQADAIAQGIHLRLLDSMISRLALRTYAEQAGVSASDQQVAEAIRAIPAVQSGLSGSFDRAAYDEFLRQLGYSQSEFEAEIRGEISTAMLGGALTAGVRAPKSYGDLLLAFETERRTISLAEISTARVGPIPAPNEVQLRDFYEDNQASLQVPEYRALTIVAARPQDFAARIDVPEQRLREEFEHRRAALTQPERRTFVQISAPDEAKARQAAERLGRGEAADDVASALGLQVVRYDQQTEAGAADSAVAEAAFAMLAGAPPRVVRGRLTPWAAVRLEQITAAQAPAFENERQRIRDEIAAEEAADLLNDAISGFEDARGSGASVADAGRANNLAVITVPAVDARGLAPDGAPAEALVDQPDLVRTAFETPEGEASDFMPAADGADVIIAVDRVIPESVRPFEEVRAQLAEAWTARERVRRMEEIARDIETAVAGGQSFADAVRANRLTMAASSQPIDRRAAAQQLPARQLGAALFSAQIGDVVRDMRVDGGALLVAVVEKIERVSPAEAPELAEQARLQMQQTLAMGLDETIRAEAATRGRVRRNERLIAQLFPRGDEDEAEEPAQ